MYIPILRKLNRFGKCPGCGLLNDINLKECSHCQRKFSKEDQLAILAYANGQREKGNRMAIYLAVTILVVALIAAVFN